MWKLSHDIRIECERECDLIRPITARLEKLECCACKHTESTGTAHSEKQ